MWIAVLLVLFICPQIVNAFPDATNTGHTAARCPDYSPSTPVTFGRIVTVNDTIIEDENIEGQIIIDDNVSGVIIRCSDFDLLDVVNESAVFVQNNEEALDLVVHDVEIHNCNSACVHVRTPVGNASLFQRIYFHDTGGDYFKCDGSCVLEDSFLEDDYKIGPGHNDGIQIAGGNPGSGEIVIRRNRIESNFQEQNAAIFVKSDFGNTDKLTVTDNLFSGGEQTITLTKGSSFDQPRNVEFRRNQWVDNSWKTGPLFSTINAGPPPIGDNCFIWENTNVRQTAKTVIGPPAGSDLTGDCWDESSMPGDSGMNPGLSGGSLTGGSIQ